MRNLLQKLLIFIFPQLRILKSPEYDFTKLRSWKNNSVFGKNVRISTVSLISNCTIGDWSYVGDNSIAFDTTIGKFCSIGPHFFCGWGDHPTNGISTHPAFYSTHLSSSLCNNDKFEEHKRIQIGNDVFIGANVTVLNGVSIGDGAIIGAGALVSKDIPPYAIAIGCPIRIIKYRFNDNQIKSLQKIQWWDFEEEQLHDVESLFYDIDSFIQKYDI